MYELEEEQLEDTETLCKKCKRYIITANYLIHEARCPGPSRIFPQNQNPNSSSLLEDKVPCQFCSYLQSLKELDTHPSVCPNRDV